MSADRELLGLAAKAAGVEPASFNGMDVGWCVPGRQAAGNWNPLADDADALWLAATLGISITPYPIYNSDGRHSVIAKQRRQSDTLREANPTEVLELYDGDPCAAWRLAIVRCAAEVGRAA